MPACLQRPPIRHVFTIVLENKSYDETFGPNSPAPYLSKQLTAQGELLTNYYGIGHNSLDNYIALMSRRPSRKFIHNTRLPSAPKAMRMPISLVLWLTVYAITP